MNEKTDRCLIEACIKKDLASWAGLVKKYSGLVYASIENRLKKYGMDASSHDIEDIKQDIFTDIWKNEKLSNITNRDDISYWVAVLAGNAAMEYFRAKDARQSKKNISIYSKIGEQDLGELIPSGKINQNDELARAEAESRVDDLIETLPREEKIMIKLHMMYNKKYREIADIMGVPKGTVSSYIRRAKEKLKEELKDIV
jgi:RNA polymerase sigma-70 factor (ECF subfamily)